MQNTITLAAGPDAELIRLAAEIDRLQDHIRSLWGAENSAIDVYNNMAPRIPAALAWRPGDPVPADRYWGKLRTRDGNRCAVCDFKEIDLRRDVARTGRLAELVEALDVYRAGERAAHSQSGLAAIEEQIAAASKQQSAVFEKMLAIEPKTLDGYRALARALVVSCYAGNLDVVERDNDYHDARGIDRLLSLLSGFPLTEVAA